MSQQLELLTDNSIQWTGVSFVTPHIQKKEIKPFVALAVKELEGNPDSRLSCLMNADKFAAVRQALRHVARLRSGTKDPWKPDDVCSFLETLKFSPECAAELSAALCRDQLYAGLPTHLRAKPGLARLHWRLDISLGQTNIRSENADEERSKEILQRDTRVILTFELTDGRTHVYRLSISKFHELRFVIASALKSVIILEKRKCMRTD